MTTIAWDGKTLAADKQSTYGDTPVPTTKIEKIKWRGESAFIGASGTIMHFSPVIEWVKTGKGKLEVDDDNKDFSVLIVTQAGNVYYATQSTFFHEMGKVQWAIGSGADFALGAMRFGATAAQAIEIASQLDTNTGLGVDTLTFGKKK